MGYALRHMNQGNRANEKECGVQTIRPTLRGGRDQFARYPRAAPSASLGVALGYFRPSLRDEVPDSFRQTSKTKLIWPRKPFMRLPRHMDDPRWK